MAEIKPFRGVLYNGGKIGGRYSDVVAPPYDVISDEARDRLYDKNEYNVIRLILGKSFDTDDENNNKYARAAKFLGEWFEGKVLTQDNGESFYVYEQEYEHDGKKHRRLGFIGLMKIEETGKSSSVLPHEHTLAKPKEDRMRLIKEVKGNLSPIFTVYDDAGRLIDKILEETVSSLKPVIDIRGEDGSDRLWRLTDTQSIKKIISCMEDKKIFIADGHHRYEVAKAYRDIRRKSGEADGSGYVMTYFANMESESELTILATHRVIKHMTVKDDAEIAMKLNAYFDVKECDTLGELMKNMGEHLAEPHVFGYFGGEKYLFLRPKDDRKILELIGEKKAAEWKELDVSVLHSAVLDKILSVNDKEGNITYVRDAERADELVKNKSHRAAFLMNPTRVSQLKAVAERGEMMPQKSTYFYPKLLTGLVIHKF